MPPATSKAWRYFKCTADSKSVKCKLCDAELTYTGGTSNMLNHLRLEQEHEIKGTPEKQPSMKDFVQSPRFRQRKGPKTRILLGPL